MAQVAESPTPGEAPVEPEAVAMVPDNRERKNYIIYMYYARKKYSEALSVIEEVLEQCQGSAEYPLFVKALIHRHRGKIQESLQLFQKATVLNPHNINNLKQVGRSLFLLGKHRAALDVYDAAQRMGFDDWEIWHNKALCCVYLKKFNEAIQFFKRANSIQRHDQTFQQLGQIYTMQENYKAAVEVYLEALEYTINVLFDTGHRFSPENPELLTTTGLLYLRLGENYRAFDFLGNSLTHDPKNAKTILAAGSIIQDHNDMDAALIKYRIAAVHTPNSAQLWNNIGMCFFGKQRYIAAIACLKKALYLDPFEWHISYNLGLVHMNSGQYASAFHYFSASINLKAETASTYMYLGIVLSRLDEYDNACSAYEKAIELESDHLFHLNFAIMLYNHDDVERATQHLQSFEELFQVFLVIVVHSCSLQVVGLS